MITGAVCWGLCGEPLFLIELLFTSVMDEEPGSEWRGVIEGCLALLNLKKGSLETLLFLKERALNEDNEDILRSIGLKEDEIHRLEIVYTVFREMEKKGEYRKISRYHDPKYTTDPNSIM